MDAGVLVGRKLRINTTTALIFAAIEDRFYFFDMLSIDDETTPPVESMTIGELLESETYHLIEEEPAEK